VLIVFLLVVIPVALFSAAIIRQGVDVFHRAQAWLEAGNLEAALKGERVQHLLGHPQIQKLWDFVSARLNSGAVEDIDIAGKLVSIAERSRNLKGHGLDEGLSTRMLIYAGSLIAKGVNPQAACRVALVRPITDDPDMRDALDAAVSTFF